MEHPILKPLIFWSGAAISLVHIYFNTLGTLSELWTAALHFGMFGLLCALLYPAQRTAKGWARTAWLWADVALGFLALASGFYLVLMEVPLYQRGVSFIAADWVVSLVAILLAVEFVRRTTGLVIPVLIVASLSYPALWGKWVSGILHFPGLSHEMILFRSYFSGEGMFGTIANISMSYVFMFVLFGAFLVRSGAGEFMVNLSRAAAGRLTGGPGLVAVLGSALMGTISGSAVANVVTTGVITIPLMKRAGFPAQFAAGVEAAASTGGMIMPPIMGAGVFIMASYTQIPYVYIIGVSVFPALMYFFSVAFWVRIVAKKQNLTAHDEDAPKVGAVLRQGGHSLIPIAVLVAMLVAGFTPTYAAGFSIVAVIVASWLSPAHRMGPWAILEALSTGARNMTPTAVLLVAVGLVVGVFGTTGLGNTISLMIGSWAGGSLLVTLILVGLASLVLGMGLPVTASYIVLATLSAPALNELIIQDHLVDAVASGHVSDTVKAVLMLVAPENAAAIGAPLPAAEAARMLALVPADMLGQIRDQILTPAAITTALLSAHMIIFWLSLDSNVTPPVCIAAFAAAAIAGTRPMATGLTSWMIAKGLYVGPILFAYTPFLAGDVWVAFRIFVFGTVGIYALSGAYAGYLETPVPLWLRPVLVGLGVWLLWPVEDVRWDWLAFVLLVAVMGLIWLLDRRRRA